MAFAWDDKPSSGAKTKDEGFFSRLVGNFANVVRSLPQLPGALYREGKEILSGPQGSRDIIEARRTGKPVPKQTDSIAEILQGPGVRLIPGAWVAGEIASGRPGSLWENPGYTILDVLPLAGKAGKLATRGSRLATEAAETARLAGKSAKALRISKEGLKLHEMGAALGRRTAPGQWTQDFLRRSGIGGPEARGTAIRISQAEKGFRDAVAEQVAPILGKDTTLMQRAFGNERIPSLAAKHGVSVERMRVITQEADFGSPGWRERLEPNERALVDETASIVDELSDIGTPLDKTRLFEFRGEVFGPEAHVLRKAIKDFTKVTRKIEGGESTPALLNRQRVAALRVNRAFERRPPAKLQSALQPRYAQALETEARAVLPEGPELNTALAMIAEGFRRDIPGIPDLKVATLIRGVNRGWQQLVAEGWDPMFLPHVSPEQAAKLGYPKLVTERIPALSIEKARTTRPGEWVPDLEVALSYTGYERLGQVHTEQLIQTLDDAGLLKNEAAAVQEGRSLAARKGLTEGQVQSFVQKHIRNNYEAWSPEGMFPFGQYRVAGRSPSYLVPKGLRGVIEGMKLPPNTLGAKLARGSQELLRTSVLDLNPFYYIGNAITAMTRQFVRGSPADLRFFPKALKMIMRDELPSELTRGARMQAIETAEHGRYMLGGKTLGRLATEAEGVAMTSRSGIKGVFKVRDALRKLSSTIDDMGRAVAYLGGSKRALRKGFSAEDAKLLGLEHANKVLNGLDDMLPLERAIIRNLLPFYGWSKFMAQTVLSYPFDHPYRAAFVTALAREVEDDWVDGLPERFRSYFFFGDPTKIPPGRIQGISAGFALPEVGVANLFTVAGFLSRVAPQYQAMLRLSGSDEFGGGPELYPNLRFDPVTGREVWERPPLPQTIATSFAPQLEAVLTPDDLEELRVNKPEIYRRVILSRLGLRLPYEIDLGEEISKAERASQRVESRDQRNEPSPVPATSGSGFQW